MRQSRWRKKKTLNKTQQPDKTPDNDRETERQCIFRDRKRQKHNVQNEMKKMTIVDDGKRAEIKSFAK